MGPLSLDDMAEDLSPTLESPHAEVPAATITGYTYTSRAWRTGFSV